MAGFTPKNYITAQNTNNQSGGFFNNLLQSLSNFGINYNDKIVTQSIAKGVYEQPFMNSYSTSNYGGADYYYRLFAERMMSNVLSRQSISYFDRTYKEKRQLLREYSQKNEIRTFIRTIVNESIVYDKKNVFCRMAAISGNYSNNIKERLHTVFNNMYNRFGFGDGRCASNYFRKFLVDGYIAFEIIYDERMRNIIGFKELDPSTLVPDIDPITKTKIWIQFPEDFRNRRILQDARVIYISYSDIDSLNDVSYVEPLIRPYNLYKIIEETIVMFRLTHATMYKKFMIPVDGLSKAQARQTIAEMMSSYEDKVEFDSATGNLSINGTANIPYSKEWWMPTVAGQSPQVELIADGQGINLLETDTIKYFLNTLRRASSIPLVRLDNETNVGGGNLYGDVGEISRDELMFARYVDSLRSNWREILLKPVWIQMCLDFPELRTNESFIMDLGIDFNKDNLYEEWKMLNNMDKKTTIIGNMLGLKETINDKEESYFDIDFLIQTRMGLSEEEIQLNKRLKEEKKKKQEYLNRKLGTGEAVEAGEEAPTTEEVPPAEEETETETETGGL